MGFSNHVYSRNSGESFWDSEGEAMSGIEQIRNATAVDAPLAGRPALADSDGLPAEASSVSLPRWYALHTHARHEKRVAAELRERGWEMLVPALREVHHWSDRKKLIEAPVFPCYAFIRTALTAEVQAAVLRHRSIFRWVGCQGQPSPIPDEEILAVQTLLRSELPVGSHAFVKAGQRVRIRGGSLDGVEGVLLSHPGGRKLVVSVHLIQQSVAVPLEGYTLERVA